MGNSLKDFPQSGELPAIKCIEAHYNITRGEVLANSVNLLGDGTSPNTNSTDKLPASGRDFVIKGIGLRHNLLFQGGSPAEQRIIQAMFEQKARIKLTVGENVMLDIPLADALPYVPIYSGNDVQFVQKPDQVPLFALENPITVPKLGSEGSRFILNLEMPALTTDAAGIAPAIPGFTNANQMYIAAFLDADGVAS